MAASVAEGTSSDAFTHDGDARASIKSGDVAVEHGHIPGRDAGLVDDTKGGKGLGDSQPLKRGLTNGTVSGGKLGVHEIVNGHLQFRMIDGLMSRDEMKAIQTNLNREQEVFDGGPK